MLQINHDKMVFHEDDTYTILPSRIRTRKIQPGKRTILVTALLSIMLLMSQLFRALQLDHPPQPITTHIMEVRISRNLIYFSVINYLVTSLLLHVPTLGIPLSQLISSSFACPNIEKTFVILTWVYISPTVLCMFLGWKIIWYSFSLIFFHWCFVSAFISYCIVTWNSLNFLQIPAHCIIWCLIVYASYYFCPVQILLQCLTILFTSSYTVYWHNQQANSCNCLFSCVMSSKYIAYMTGVSTDSCGTSLITPL